ncbi:MAG: hypothetical protein AB4352_26575 [Hormoscilla sp.]
MINTSKATRYDDRHQRNTSYIVATATFDGQGIPREHHIFNQNSDIEWMQAAFQTISLKMLLSSGLGLEGFSRAVVRGHELSMVVTKQKSGYKAVVYSTVPQKTPLAPVTTPSA